MQGHVEGACPWQHCWAAIQPRAAVQRACLPGRLAPHSSNAWQLLPSNRRLLLLVASHLTADAEPGLAEHKVRAACTFPGNVTAGLSGNNAEVQTGSAPCLLRASGIYHPFHSITPPLSSPATGPP